MFEVWNKQKSPSKGIYIFLNDNNKILQGITEKWNYEFDLSNDELIRATNRIYQITNYAKYRAFQYRLLLRAITTNKHLFHYKLKNTAMCAFCDVETETLQHLFYGCIKVNNLWQKVFNWIELEARTKCKVSWKNILLNTIEDNPKLLSNFIVLACKYYIYSVRCINEDLSFEGFKKTVRLLKDTESFIAKRNNKIQKHRIKWEAFKQL